MTEPAVETNPNLQALDQRSRDKQSAIDSQEEQSKQRIQELDASNAPLKSCVGSCKIEEDFVSEKALTAKKLSDIDSEFRETMRRIELDGTMTNDLRLLMSQEVLDDAKVKFEEVVVDQFLSIDTMAKAEEIKLFTNNHSLSQTDISLMANQKYINGLLAKPFQNPLEPKSASIENKGNARVALELLNRGMFEETVASGMADSLNSRHSKEPYNNLKTLQRNAHSLKDILDIQTETFRRLSYPSEKIEQIRAARYKG